MSGRTKVFSWVVILILILSNITSLNAQSCGLGNFSACDVLYQKGQYELLINSFDMTELAANTNARLSRYYYLTIGYFGLYKHERSAAKKCFYLDKARVFRFKFARDVIKNFGETSDFGLDRAATKVLFVRNIGGQMDHQKGCLEAPYSEVKVDYMIMEKVKNELSKYATFLVSPELNPLKQLSEIIKNTLSITSNCMNKNGSFDIELTGLSYVLSGIKSKLDLWQKEDSINGNLNIPLLKKRNDRFLNTLNEIDVESLKVDLNAKEINNSQATDLIKTYYYATLFADLLNPMRNRHYLEYKERVRQLVREIDMNGNAGEMDLMWQQMKMNIRERDKPFYPIDVCTSPALKKWYCR